MKYTGHNLKINEQEYIIELVETITQRKVNDIIPYASHNITEDFFNADSVVTSRFLYGYFTAYEALNTPELRLLGNTITTDKYNTSCRPYLVDYAIGTMSFLGFMINTDKKLDNPTIVPPPIALINEYLIKPLRVIIINNVNNNSSGAKKAYVFYDSSVVPLAAVFPTLFANNVEIVNLSAKVTDTQNWSGNSYTPNLSNKRITLKNYFVTDNNFGIIEYSFNMNSDIKNWSLTGMSGLDVTFATQIEVGEKLKIKYGIYLKADNSLVYNHTTFNTLDGSLMDVDSFGFTVNALYDSAIHYIRFNHTFEKNTIDLPITIYEFWNQ